MNFRKDLKKVATGVYKNQKSKKFFAEIRVNGKSHSKTFTNLYDAKRWRKELACVAIKPNNLPPAEIQQEHFSTLQEVWQAIKQYHFPTLATSTKAIWTRRYQLLKNLEHLPMNKITPATITSWINFWVEQFKTSEYQSRRGKAGRCNLNAEINMFVTIFNWYKESEMFEQEATKLTCPVRKRHRKLGFIKPVPTKKKQIDLQDALTFFSLLRPLYKDLAMMQFYCAGRVGEIAGMQWSNVELSQRRLIIKQTCVWDSVNKTFVELKQFPKNREPRVVFITDEIMAILKRQMAFKIEGNDFVFHVEGKPLNYCTIQLNYREAQRKGKLPYSGTHILRHGMAKLARQVGGGLDAVIAMTGHKDIKLADHYSKCNEDDQKYFSTKIMEHIRKVGHSTHDLATTNLDKTEEQFENVISLASFKQAHFHQFNDKKIVKNREKS